MLKTLIRTLSVAFKELSEVRRQPRLMITLVVGPFLVLLLFGLGYNVAQPPLNTVVVLPQQSGLRESTSTLKQQFPYPFVLKKITEDQRQAQQLVNTNQMDVAVIIPSNIEQQAIQGHRSQLKLYYKQADPVYGSWIPYFGQGLVANLNQQIVENSLSKLQEQAAQKPGVQSNPQAARLTQVPAKTLTAPLMLQQQNLAPYSPTLVAYYAPGVLALILQHIAITLAALSVVRERQIGAMEIYRVSPVGVFELFVGKYIGYGLITLIVGAILTALMYYVLHIPLFGSLVIFAITLLVLTFGSISLGLLISTLSRSDSQAVQLSMLTLLASMFFSGFFLPLATLANFVKVVSYALPVTYGVISLKQVMLFGEVPMYRFFLAPLGIGLLAIILAWILMKRELARA